MKTWAIAAALALLPVAGLAQNNAPLPTYARPAGETIKGTIRNFDGKYKLYVRDTRGYIDDVTLHDGTIINPTGIRLQSGFPVTITGHTNGSTFEADVIDTPFKISYAYPYYGYPSYGPYPYGYGYGYGYPYPFYGYFGAGWRWR
jgi:hypothetical protein